MLEGPKRNRARKAEAVVVPGSDPQAKKAVARYFAELEQRFTGGFDSAEEMRKDQTSLAFDPPYGNFVLIMSSGEVLACGGIRTFGAGIGEVKRMWVDPDWRGFGLGRRLLTELERLASELGHHTLRLDTNDSLTEAIALYLSSGFIEVPAYANDNPYARHWFEKPLRTGSSE